jgi:hypothetical protein
MIYVVMKCLFAACFALVSCLAYSSTLKMEAICSSETSVGFHGTTRRYIPEDGTAHSDRCGNLRCNNCNEVSSLATTI